MKANILVTLTRECFRATFQHTQSSYSDCLSYLFRVEDLIANRGIRCVSVVFTRPARVNAHDFESRVHLLCWSAIRRGFDRKMLSFEIEPKDPDQYIELKVKGDDVDPPQRPASDDIVREYLVAKLYWLGYKFRPYDNPVQTWVDLESEEDFDYLGATREVLRRVAWRMEQDGLLHRSAISGVGNPTDKLLKLFEEGPREVPLMKEHERILDLAARDKLPERIDSASCPSPDVAQELIDAGYLKAIDASSNAGVAFLNPKITLAGREYLAQLREKPEEEQMKEKKLNNRPLDMSAAISGGQYAWSEIKREYDISKSTLGKRISFVKDEFKRNVIFRDVEQAWILANYDFHKPAVILAGGVIEELLRLYLEYKNVTPERNNLDSYIKACDTNGFMKGAIHKLADSVRQFRNIVHLENEVSSKHSISKAAAKGAVSSIFTIANELST